MLDAPTSSLTQGRQSAGPTARTRHAWHLVPVGALTVLAAVALFRAVPPDQPAAALLDGLTLLNLALLAHGAWHSILGFALTLLPREFGPRPFELPPALPTGRASTAILVPVFGEDPVRVAAAVAVMRRSLAAGTAGRVEIFVLSDTVDPTQAEAERVALDAMRPGQVPVFWRRRPCNVRRKAGNVAAWCERWGREYDFMLVLDADSLVTGSAVARLVGLMEATPSAGMIQTMCWPAGHVSLFARVLQAGARLQSSLSVRGLAFWQGPYGAWWGHNAIIRTAAFMRHCGLPDLPGRAPLGGEILCHDTIEAAMMVRAGWGVWLVTDVEGSYEEAPTNLVDFLVRERRWCQGNLQHAGVLARADGLALGSWLHIASGMLHYATAPLFLVFAAILVSWDGGQAHDQVVHDLDWAWLLASLSLTLVLLPRLLAVMLVLRTPGETRRYGGVLGLCASLAAEQGFAFLLGPTMLLFHIRFVIATLAGRSVVWAAQDRRDRCVSWAEAWQVLGWPTLAGAAIIAAISLAAETPWLAWAFLPGLLLAVPFAVFSSRSELGRLAARLRLFVTPDETAPTPELAELMAARPAPAGTGGLWPLPPDALGPMQVPRGFRRSALRPAVAADAPFG